MLPDLDESASDEGARPEPPTAEEKEALAALFRTADPYRDRNPAAAEAMAELHQRED